LSTGVTLTYQSRLAKHRHVLWTSNTQTTPQIGEFSDEFVMTLPLSAFKHQLAPLKSGRFYPANILNTAEAMPAQLFRVAKLDGGSFTADFNHPLARHDVHIGSENSIDRACGSTSPSELIRWAGIESPLAEGDVDFSDTDAFERDDHEVDALFYAAPRKVMHMDSVCAERIEVYYRSHLASDAVVLDLMSSWRSHLPDHAGAITGLGMNIEELSDNPQLHSFIQHDLNTATCLPFDKMSFDAVINTVSIEYLTQPMAVLQDLQRILKPGGKILITFSNRFFPPKTIALWKRLHPVERMGWVVQCLHAAGFTDVNTLLERGLRRDPADRYSPQLKEMDPLFAVSAQKPAVCPPL
jgi:hypothetical protein